MIDFGCRLLDRWGGNIVYEWDIPADKVHFTSLADEEKECFWNEVFHLVSCIHQNEIVVFAGDMNGHVGSSNVGYDGTHGGFGCGSRNADGSRILEFADGLNLVI